MPRAPRPSAHALGVRASTFEAFQGKLKARAAAGDLIPLHLGDTWLPPPPAARRVDLEEAGLYRYGPITGEPPLRRALAQEVARHGFPAHEDQVVVTVGATGALDVAFDAMLEPGDEVLILTPCWPLVFGLVQRRGARPVEVDVDPSGALPADPARLAAALRAAIGPRTVALYLCDPNNPAGFVYSPAQQAAIAAVAREHDLWLLVDAVYVDLEFAPRPAPLAAWEAVRERTCLVFSWSKACGLAGERIGALLAPPPLLALAPRLITHTTYHASRVAQRMLLLALQASDVAQDRARRREAAAAGAALVEARLGGLVTFPRPAGGAFVLLDLRQRVDDEAAGLRWLEASLDRGVALAPGGAFGSRFGRFARLCFTATPPDALEEGLARLAGLLRG